MPEKRLARTRASLPSDYQFGDAGQHVLRAIPVASTGIFIRYVRQYDIKVDLFPTRYPRIEDGLWKQQ